MLIFKMNLWGFCKLYVTLSVFFIQKSAVLMFIFLILTSNVHLWSFLCNFLWEDIYRRKKEIWSPWHMNYYHPHNEIRYHQTDWLIDFFCFIYKCDIVDKLSSNWYMKYSSVQVKNCSSVEVNRGLNAF